MVFLEILGQFQWEAPILTRTGCRPQCTNQVSQDFLELSQDCFLHNNFQEVIGFGVQRDRIVGWGRKHWGCFEVIWQLKYACVSIAYLPFPCHSNLVIGWNFVSGFLHPLSTKLPMCEVGHKSDTILGELVLPSLLNWFSVVTEPVKSGKFSLTTVKLLGI